MAQSFYVLVLHVLEKFDETMNKICSLYLKSFFEILAVSLLTFLC